MTRQVGDDVSTNEVVWAAAERIGKSSNPQDINRICDYLISKQWFQTAGDLRVARENAQEWMAFVHLTDIVQFLDVPGRLKIAIQEVLDAQLETAYSPGKHHAQSGQDQSVEGVTDGPRSRILPNTHESQLAPDPCAASLTAISAVDQTTLQYAFYGEECGEQVPVPPVPDYEQTSVNSCTYDGSDYNGVEASYIRTDYDASYITQSEDEAAAAAAHAAAWEAYYAANGYYSYGASEQTASGSWDYSSYANNTQPCEEVVEAQEVSVEEAVAAEPELEIHDDGFGSRLPQEAGTAISAQLDTWSCGQCTFINRIEVSFCEMCCGHYSLSQDTRTDPPQPAAINEVEPAVVSPEVIVVDLQSSCLPNPELAASPLVHEVETSQPPHSGAEEQTAEVPSIAPHVLEPPLYVAIPSPSKPSSPLYSPSAPDFEDPSVPSEHTAKLEDLGRDTGKVSEICAPSPSSVAAPSPSPPKIDYRALAFKRTPSMPSGSTVVPPGSSDGRLHCTEFAF